MDRSKLSLLDNALRHRNPPPRSVADLGGVWGVDGAYAFWVRERLGIERVVLADSDFSESAIERCRATPGVDAVPGLLGDPSVVSRVGEVDAIILFDVLLHQVAPNWDELLAMYAPHTRCFVVFNPQWTGGGDSFRLLDLGREEYFEQISHSESEPGYDHLFDRLDERYEPHGRPLRDVHYIWQWAITDRDLRVAMARLGFEEVLFCSDGRFGSCPNFERHGFVFDKLA